MTDLFLLGTFAILAAIGTVVVIAQARFEYRKRKAFKDIYRIVQRRGQR